MPQPQPGYFVDLMNEILEFARANEQDCQDVHHDLEHKQNMETVPERLEIVGLKAAKIGMLARALGVVIVEHVA